ncbi:MAG: hypothetical protein IJT95_02380 [Abditibacteriota bacterium]|nr:hypothetical protein [Abditibacteriota bacterium]
MKNVLLVIVCILTAGLLMADEYDFDGSISQKTLEAYLARAIGYNGICCLGQEFPERYHEDSLRALANVKPKYVSRAVLGWTTPADAEKHFAAARKGAEEVHRIDSQIILEAAIFEAVYSVGETDVNKIPVPAWAFEALGLPAADRCFRYEDMLFPDGRYRDCWGAGISAPDITRPETQLWEYYRACRYIDAGYEAINFGHIAQMSLNDPEMEVWEKLLGLVREYGRKHARRHYVLLTGHMGPGIVAKNGRLLWDYAQYPLRLVTDTKPLRASLFQGHFDSTYNALPGGLHPGGFRCSVIPSLYELDNCFSGIDVNQRHLVWGTDETTWFANCRPGYRNYFLKYAASWLSSNVQSAYLMMPGCRPAGVPIVNPERYTYFCNEPSDSCPAGGGQEETIKALFAERFDLKPSPAPKPERKRGRGEQLGFHPVENGIAERLFLKADSCPVGNYTNGYVKDVFEIYGIAGREKPEDFTPAPDRADISPEGLSLAGPTAEAASFPEISGGRLSVYLCFRLSPEAFEDSFSLLEKFVFMKSGYYIKYYKPADSLYAEIFDGSGERRVMDFPVPKDGEVHRICFTCDGKTLTGWLDGEECGSVPAGEIVPNLHNLFICGGVDGLLKDIKVFNYALGRNDARALTAGLWDLREAPMPEPTIEISGEIGTGRRRFGIRIGF